MSIFVYVIKVKVNFINIYLIFATFFISLIASLKYPVTDLKFYVTQFQTYGEYSFIDFYEAVYKDHLFYFINKIIYEIGFTSSQFFTFFWAFIFYSLILRAVFLLFKSKFIDKEQLVLITLFFLLSVEYLILSTHLIRQFVAGALLVYFITSVMLSKRSYVALFSLSFIHFSSIIFVLMYPILKHKLSFKFSTLIVIGVVFLLIFSINIEYFNGLHFNIGTLDTIIDRVVNARAVNVDNGELSYKMYVISSVSLIILFYLIYNNNNNLYILIFNYLLFGFLIVLVTLDIPLLTLRFSFYQYSFYILALIIFTREFINNVRVKFLLFILLLLLYSLRFYMYFENNLWINDNHYEQILFKSIFFYIG